MKSREMSKSTMRSEKSLQEERIDRKRSIRHMYETYILLERENRNLMSEITNNENFLDYILENSRAEANNFLLNVEEVVNGDVKPRYGLENPFIKKHISKIMDHFEKKGYDVKRIGWTTCNSYNAYTASRIHTPISQHHNALIVSLIV